MKTPYKADHLKKLNNPKNRYNLREKNLNDNFWIILKTGWVHHSPGYWRFFLASGEWKYCASFRRQPAQAAFSPSEIYLKSFEVVREQHQNGKRKKIVTWNLQWRQCSSVLNIKTEISRTWIKVNKKHSVRLKKPCLIPYKTKKTMFFYFYGFVCLIRFFLRKMFPCCLVPVQ